MLTLSREGFQSTHPRGVRRFHGPRRAGGNDVSIHAPAWGATLSCLIALPSPGRFNPRTRVGCDNYEHQKEFAQNGFNPRTRVGCDTSSGGSWAALSWFQSTHPRGVRRPRALAASAGSWWFQSTHPRGVRRMSNHACPVHFVFQSTHPRGVRLQRGFQAALAAWFQSTHPRGVRHLGGYMAATLDKVSIHAPAWGATGRSLDSGHDGHIVSIHAPAWGATLLQAVLGQPSPGFNPRTRVGCDDNSRRPPDLRDYVSIHAPAWGATSPSDAKASTRCVSIHAPAWGATRKAGWNMPTARFQSTHPRGVRQEHRALYGSRYVVSIHAPAWGATNRFRAVNAYLAVSIHAPAWGATSIVL